VYRVKYGEKDDCMFSHLTNCAIDASKLERWIHMQGQRRTIVDSHEGEGEEEDDM
jgi:hypothetical protein